METKMYRKLFLLLIIVLSFKGLISEEKLQKDTAYGSLNKSWSISLGLGAALPTTKSFDEDDEVEVEGVGYFPNYDNNTNTNGNFAAFIRGKYNFSNYFAAGIEFHYHMTSLNKFDISLERIDMVSVVRSDNLGIMHVFSFQAFVEGRFPLQINENLCFVPYLRLGLGLNLNQFDGNELDSPSDQSSEDLFDFSSTTFAFSVGAGAELLVTKSIGVFVEAMWHYNSADLEVTEENHRYTTKFQLDARLSVVSIFAGVTFYFK